MYVGGCLGLVPPCRRPDEHEFTLVRGARLNAAAPSKETGVQCPVSLCFLPGATVHTTYSPFNQVRGLVTWHAERVVDAISTTSAASETLLSFGQPWTCPDNPVDLPSLASLAALCRYWQRSQQPTCYDLRDCRHRLC